tara:strand:+ start:1163 stop:1360 length:198 start_codon:yes stop_codon:yes gene_type:complete
MELHNKLLSQLKDRQTEFSVEALKKPQTRDVFEYGYLVGTVAGLEEAINVLLNLLNEEKYSDNDL